MTTLGDTRNGLIAKDGYAHYNQSVALLYAPLDGFKDAMHHAGVMTDVPIVADGEIHRFKPEGEKRMNGWYVFFGDGGAFGNWRTGLKENWYRGDICQSDRRKIQAQVKAAQKALQDKRQRKHRQSARIAARRWEAATPTTEHPYLEAKGVRSHDLRIEDRNLLVPVCHRRQIWSLQVIYPDGRKRFLSGGRTTGCYFPIGTPGERIWLAEGYATAATVHELTGDAVVCAFNAGNRRFWPVRCDQADLKALRRDRDQLWAEALTAYRNGEQWWLEGTETELAREEQAERFEHDVWQDPVNKYLEDITKSRVTGLDIMEECLDLARSQQNVVTGRRVSQIMAQAGWERADKRLTRKDKDGIPRKIYTWKNPKDKYLVK